MIARAHQKRSLSPAVETDLVKRPSILVFDSGLGGLTVFRATAALRPEADYVYFADDAGFPYGPMAPDVLIERVMGVIGKFIRTARPDLVVIACNTASTLVLPPLRAAFPDLPFVGTVPAIKPAAASSRSKMVSVLATPGTVVRDYTRDLIAAHASDCQVTLVGAPRLAPLAEDFLRGIAVEEREIAAEIAPCFVEAGGQRTDTVVLACTHYPLLREMFERNAPWPVDWVDPAPAIARRVASLLGEPSHTTAGTRHVFFSSGLRPDATLERALLAFGLVSAEPGHVALCA